MFRKPYIFILFTILVKCWIQPHFPHVQKWLMIWSLLIIHFFKNGVKYIIPCMLSLQPLKNLNYVWNTYLVKCHKYAWLLVELWTEYLELFFQKIYSYFCIIWEAPLNHVECKSRKMLNNKISCHKLTQTRIFHFFFRSPFE